MTSLLTIFTEYVFDRFLTMVISPWIENIAWAMTIRSPDMTGYYRTKWKYHSDKTNSDNDVYDIVYLEKRGHTVNGHVYYSNDTTRLYRFHGKERGSRISGQWVNAEYNYEGDFTLIRKFSQRNLEGIWAGKDNNDRLQVEPWVWEKIDITDSSRYITKLDFNKQKHQQAIKSFVARLDQEALRQKNVDINGINIQIDRNIFSPHIGEISLEFFRLYVSPIVNADVLDLCTGTGLYAIKLSKNGCRTIAVDSDVRSLQIAQINAQNNSVHVDFREGNMYEPIHNDEKFDVIVANLPFTSPENAQSIRNTGYYKYLSLREEMLKDFILGALMHLNEKGKVLFTFGTSGDIEYLYHLISLSSLHSTLLKKIDRPDIGETFYIFQLQRRS